MSTLRAWFRGRFGAELPLRIDGPLEQRPGETAWMTPGLAMPHLPMIPGFSDGPYVLAGEWGRGVNSFGFYFVEVRPAHRRFFRLISGSGAYGDGTEAKEVVAYLEGYESWKARYESRCKTSELIHNLGVSKASLELAAPPGPGRDNSVTLAKMDEDGPWWTLLAQAIEG